MYNIYKGLARFTDRLQPALCIVQVKKNNVREQNKLIPSLSLNQRKAGSGQGSGFLQKFQGFIFKKTYCKKSD
jgi:hypothetical protein